MVDWQITATTIFCADVEDEVTLMVYGDGAVKCTAQPKYAQHDKETVKILKKKGKQTGKTLACLGANCPRVPEYRDKWLKK
jgi:hypothetical protein